MRILKVFTKSLKLLIKFSLNTLFSLFYSNRIKLSISIKRRRGMPIPMRRQGHCRADRDTVQCMSTQQAPNKVWRQLIVFRGRRNEDEWVNDPQTVAHKQSYQRKTSSPGIPSPLRPLSLSSFTSLPSAVCCSCSLVGQ